MNDSLKVFLAALGSSVLAPLLVAVFFGSGMGDIGSMVGDGMMGGGMFGALFMLLFSLLVIAQIVALITWIVG